MPTAGHPWRQNQKQILSVLMVLLNTIPQEYSDPNRAQAFQHADKLYEQHLASLSIPKKDADNIELFFTVCYGSLTHRS